MKQRLLLGLFSLLTLGVYAQDPDVGGSQIEGTTSPAGTPFFNTETVYFTIAAGAAAGADLTFPAPGGAPFSVAVSTVRITNPVVTFSSPNYFTIDTKQVSATVNGQIYEITFTQNQTIPEGMYTIFTITGQVQGTSGQTVSYQANGNPGGYNTTNKGLDNPSSSRAIGQDPMPVNLVSFQGQWTEEKGNQLNWVTAWERNSDHFEIQSSATAKSFETIGRVTAKGTTAQQQAYAYIDAAPIAELSYYRLKQVDVDGRISYSKIISVRQGETTNHLVVYPNPTADELKVQLSANQSAQEISIYKVSGERVLHQRGMDSVLQLPMLGAGVYVVEVKTDQGQLLRQRFVKL